MEKTVEIERSIIKKYKKPIWHRFIGGCKDYRLVNAGDRIAVCISGGKDSFLLAKCMQQLQKHSDVPFELEFLCMDPGYRPENRAMIERNAALMGVPLHIFETDIFDTVVNIEQSPCYLCARMRRGHLYKNARALGCNKIALGHHFRRRDRNDAYMSMLWGAEVKTMMPKLHSTNYPGMELIRPLYLVRETDILAWKRYNGLTFLQCACRFTEQEADEGMHGARSETKALIAALRKTNPQADVNIFRSMHHVNLNMALGWTQDGSSAAFWTAMKHSALRRAAGRKTSEQARKNPGRYWTIRAIPSASRQALPVQMTAVSAWAKTKNSTAPRPVPAGMGAVLFRAGGKGRTRAAACGGRGCTRRTERWAAAACPADFTVAPQARKRSSRRQCRGLNKAPHAVFAYQCKTIRRGTGVFVAAGNGFPRRRH